METYQFSLILSCSFPYRACIKILNYREKGLLHWTMWFYINSAVLSGIVCFVFLADEQGLSFEQGKKRQTKGTSVRTSFILFVNCI